MTTTLSEMFFPKGFSFYDLLFYILCFYFLIFVGFKVYELVFDVQLVKCNAAITKEFMNTF